MRTITPRAGTDEITRTLKTIVSRGVSQALGLWGEPGIGKTHTAHQVLREIPCPHLSLPATTPQAEIIHALPRTRKPPTWAAVHLERMARGEPVEPRVLAETITALLSGIAPFILHLEDLHETNPEQRECIRQLAQSISRTRGLGLIVTSRTEPPPPFKPHRLEGLEFEATKTLLEQQLGAPPPHEGLEWIQARTRGNPLFTLEFQRYLTRQGFLWNDGTHWHWRTPASDFVPVTIEALIEQAIRAATDTPEPEAALHARVMIESNAGMPLWATVSGLGPIKLEAACVHLEQRGILYNHDFVHPLYREVAARMLGADQQRVFAKRALEALEHDPQAAAAFVDAANPGQDEKRLRFERAAQAAEAAGQFIQAGRWLARAAEHAQGPERGQLARKAALHLNFTDTPEVIRLNTIALRENPNDLGAVFDLAGCHAQLGASAEVERVLEACPNGVKAQASWVVNLIKLRMAQGNFQETLNIWNQHPEHHTNPEPLLANAVGFARMMLNDPQGAETIVKSALKRSDLHPRIRSQLLVVLGLAHEKRDQLEPARACLDEAVLCARTTEKPVVLASALYNRQIVLERLLLIPEMIADLREAQELYQRAGEAQKYASTLNKLGLVLHELGQFEEAELTYLEAHETLVRFGDSRFLITCEVGLSDLYLVWQPPHGQQLAQKYAQQALDLARQPRFAHKLFLALDVASRAATWNAQAQRGLQLAEECLQSTDVDAAKAYGYNAQAVALEALGQPDHAREAYRQVRSRVDEHSRWGIDLELARLNGDIGAARKNLELLRQHGLMAAVYSALRKWPALASDASSEPPSHSEPSTRLEVLGPVRLERHGQTVTYRGRKRTEILAYLLEARVSGRSEVNTLELLDVFYPNDPEPEAKNTLRQQIHLIRSSLGPLTVMSTANGYALGAMESDAEEFLRTGKSSLWRGTYLEGLGDGWFSGVRDALTLALHARVEALLNVDAREAARLGRLLFQMEPFDVDALRLCILALRASGDGRAARRLFDESRDQLLAVDEHLPPTLEAFLFQMTEVMAGSDD